MAYEKNRLAAIWDNFLIDLRDISKILQKAETLLMDIWTQQEGDFGLSRPITLFPTHHTTILRIFHQVLHYFPIQTLQFLRKWV